MSSVPNPVRVTALTIAEEDHPDQITLTMPARHFAVLTHLLAHANGLPREAIDIMTCGSDLFDKYFEDSYNDAVKELT